VPQYNSSDSSHSIAYRSSQATRARDVAEPSLMFDVTAGQHPHAYYHDGPAGLDVASGTGRWRQPRPLNFDLVGVCLFAGTTFMYSERCTAGLRRPASVPAILSKVTTRTHRPGVRLIGSTDITVNKGYPDRYLNTNHVPTRQKRIGEIPEDSGTCAELETGQVRTKSICSLATDYMLQVPDLQRCRKSRTYLMPFSSPEVLSLHLQSCRTRCCCLPFFVR
jgi:hypothetical protein